MQNVSRTLKIIISDALPPDDTYTDEHSRAKSTANSINSLKVPHLRKILKVCGKKSKFTPPFDALNTPAETAYAQAMHWNFADGEIPFAALKAAELKLRPPANAKRGAWGFITLCSWQVQHGQVTFIAQAHALGLTHQESDEMLRAMQPYFEEDSIYLLSHPQLNPGQWLAYSEHFKDLASASVSRVTGRIIDDFLIGTGRTKNHPSAGLLRRLQNEMQMLLYQHSINDHRSVPINSFWISATGELTIANSKEEAFNNTALNSESQTQHSIGMFDILSHAQDTTADELSTHLSVWSSAWERFDESVLRTYLDTFLDPKCEAQITLCNDTKCITLSNAKPSWLRRFMQHFNSRQLSTLLGI